MVRRFYRVLKEYGVWGGFIHIARQLCPLHINMIFRIDTPLKTINFPQMTIFKYSHFLEIGPEIQKALVESRGMGLIREFECLFRLGGQLWMCFYGHEVAGICWSRSGQSRPDYFVPLQTNDANILSCFVFPQFRGRGIYPAMLKYIVSALGDHNNIRRVFIDCKSWNYPSVRGIEKAGFRFIGRSACMVVFGRVAFRFPRYILL